MPKVSFDSVSMQENCLRLHGKYFHGAVYLLENGIWRIFVWHRSQDKHKKSWVLEEQQLQAFDYSQSQQNLMLQSDDKQLELSLKPFSWKWQNFDVQDIEGHRDHLHSDAGAMVDAATGEGNPIAEINDGLPLGAGMTLSWHEAPQRYYFGLGERTGFLDKKGRKWINWTYDDARHQPNTDPLYQSHPFFIAVEDNRAWGVYIDETWYSEFDLAYSDPQTSSFFSKGPTLDVYLIPGPTAKDVVMNYSRMIGKPYMAPLWAFGNHQCRWSYPDEETIQAVVDDYQQHQIPLSAIWFDIDYMESYKVFTFSPYRFSNVAKLVADLKQQDIHTVVIVDPGVKAQQGYSVYEEGKQLDAFVKNRRDEDYIGEVWPGKVVWPDFSLEKVRDWWGQMHKFYLDSGIAGIWNDMNEPAAFNIKTRTLPTGCKHGPYWHAEIHNLYGYLMSQATYQGLQKLQPDKRPFVLTRSGFAGIQKYAWVWTGDNSSFWEHLEMSVPMLLNMGLSGMPFVGADIGGFSGDCDGELLARWTWLGAFYPFMRNHSGKGSRRQEPWAFQEPYTQYVKKAVEFRYRLLPYIYTLAHEAYQSGLPLMRPLFLEYPEDAETYPISDQFLFGPSLLVAPIIKPQQTKRLVYLPEGTWQNFWTGEYVSGKQWVIAEAGLDQIPLWQKTGTAIATVDTTTSNSCKDWKIVWRVALGEDISGEVYLDAGDGEVNGEIRSLEATYHNQTFVAKKCSGNIELVCDEEPKSANVKYQKQNKILRFVGVDDLQIQW